MKKLFVKTALFALVVPGTVSVAAPLLIVRGRPVASGVTFGDEYLAYRKRVGRWLPKRSRGNVLLLCFLAGFAFGCGTAGAAGSRRGFDAGVDSQARRYDRGR